MNEVPAAQYVTDSHVFQLVDGDLISDVLVLGLVIDADGDQGVLIASGGMKQVTKTGLVESAKQILTQTWQRRDDD